MPDKSTGNSNMAEGECLTRTAMACLGCGVSRSVEGCALFRKVPHLQVVLRGGVIELSMLQTVRVTPALFFCKELGHFFQLINSSNKKRELRAPRRWLSGRCVGRPLCYNKRAGRQGVADQRSMPCDAASAAHPAGARASGAALTARVSATRCVWSHSLGACVAARPAAGARSLRGSRMQRLHPESPSPLNPGGAQTAR